MNALQRRDGGVDMHRRQFDEPEVEPQPIGDALRAVVTPSPLEGAFVQDHLARLRTEAPATYCAWWLAVGSTMMAHEIAWAKWGQLSKSATGWNISGPLGMRDAEILAPVLEVAVAAIWEMRGRGAIVGERPQRALSELAKFDARLDWKQVRASLNPPRTLRSRELEAALATGTVAQAQLTTPKQATPAPESVAPVPVAAPATPEAMREHFRALATMEPEPEAEPAGPTWKRTKAGKSAKGERGIWAWSDKAAFAPIDEVAVFLGCSARTVKNRAKEGKLVLYGFMTNKLSVCLESLREFKAASRIN